MTLSTQKEIGPDQLLYKVDWPKARNRFIALWDGEIIDRPCIAITAPREKQVPLPPPPITEFKYTVPDIVTARTNAKHQNTFYGGEALPFGRTLLGFGAFGGKVVFEEKGLWVHPSISNWDTPYFFEPNVKCCHRFIEITNALIIDGHKKNKYLLETIGVHPPLDALAAMRGTENLCLDMLTNPDEVKSTLQELMRGFRWLINNRLSSIPQTHGWYARSLWAPGKITSTRCEFASLIGPQLFEELVVPEIKEICSILDFSVHQMNGVQSLQHLEAILEIKELNAISWERGSNDIKNGSALRWAPLCKQVQESGKIFTIEMKLEEVKPFLKEVKPTKLLIKTQTPTMETAQDILQKAEDWY